MVHRYDGSWIKIHSYEFVFMIVQDYNGFGVHDVPSECRMFDHS